MDFHLNLSLHFGLSLNIPLTCSLIVPSLRSRQLYTLEVITEMSVYLYKRTDFACVLSVRGTTRRETSDLI